MPSLTSGGVEEVQNFWGEGQASVRGGECRFSRGRLLCICVWGSIKVQIFDGGAGFLCVCVWQVVGVGASKGTGLYVWESADFPGGEALTH